MSLLGIYKSLFPIRITGYSGERLKNELNAFAGSLPTGTKVLDAGAGDLHWKYLFSHCDYKSADVCYPENGLDASKLDYVVDMENMKEIANNSFDAVFSIAVLEHVKHPQSVINEFKRVLKPGGRPFLHTCPSFEDHQIPNHFFNTTQYGIRLLFDEAGLETKRIEYTTGYFAYIADIIKNFWFYFGSSFLFKLLDALTYPVYFVLASVLIFLDRFDTKKTLSSSVISEAMKP